MGVSLIWNIPLRTIVVVSYVLVRHVSLERRKLRLSIWKLSKVRNCYFVLIKNLSVIRQKGECQNGYFKKTKHAKFSKKRTFLTPPPPPPLKPSFWGLPFCLITDELFDDFISNSSMYFCVAVDPYCIIEVEGAKVRTPHMSDNLNPTFNYGGVFYVKRPTEARIKIQVCMPLRS